MPEEYLVRNCAPTLAGLKTGSMFTCPYTSREELLSSLRCMNCRLRAKGLRLIPLRFSQEKALLYLFRPKNLSKDLTDSTAAELLKQEGYDPEDCSSCIVHLRRKLREQAGFPHEIGLFLGYPAEDVCGFIENRSCNCKCMGCWKVYGDEESAKKKFAQYKKCTRVYCDRLAQGSRLERLAVSSR